MSRKRVQRVAETIKREMGDILAREASDPRLSLVTVTDVELSDDLKYAKVYVSFVGGDREKRIGIERLRKAVGFLRTELAGRIRLRTVPHLTFLLDETSENYLRINEVLKQIHEEDGDRNRDES